MSLLFVNVIHRVDAGPVRLEAVRFQQETARRFGLPTTLLLTFGALRDPAAIAYARDEQALGNELGLHLHELMCPAFRERFGTDEKAFWLLPREIQRGVLDTMIDEFTRHFGRPPTAIGSYVLDADCLAYLREHHPSVRVAITNCFEEGVRMYQGNNQEWCLFSDGGPWGAYHPSRACHLVPAASADEAVGIVGLPHLNRDMVLSLTSRDDLFSSHPSNLIRARANLGDRCDYLLHLIDLWLEQVPYNSHGYYSLFVSPPWVAAGHPFVEDPADARALYEESLAYLRDRQDAGLARCVTMTEFADWFRAAVPPGQPEVNLSRDLLMGSGRQMFWYVDSHLRVAIDLNAGASICDLRPYSGRIDRNLGPQTPSLWNGNYPFLISTGLRGGPRTGPVHTCEIRCRGKTLTLVEGRTTGRIERDAGGRTELVTDPIELSLDEVRVTVQSVYRFPGDGVVAIERRLLAVSDPAAVVELRELHRGCWGTTEYPEDLRGVTLRATGPDGRGDAISYAYGSRRLTVERPASLGAELPALGCRVVLEPADRADHGEVIEGHLFRPFYTLALTRRLEPGQSLQCRLRLSAR